MAKKTTTKKSNVEAVYEKDSKRFHRYSVGEQGDPIVGTLYFSREMKNIPDEIVVKVKKK